MRRLCRMFLVVGLKCRFNYLKARKCLMRSISFFDSGKYG